MTDNTPKIAGAFGGGSSNTYQSRTPTIYKDTLQSRAYGRILDLLSEGEIEGLVDGDKSIFVDDVPLQDQDGTYNFTDVTRTLKTGTQNQDYIPLFPAVETETSVGQTITAKNNLQGSWSREWSDSTFTRSGTDITVTWNAHGMIAGDSVFLNFKDYNSPYDKLYTINSATTNTFVVTRHSTGFTRTSGQVYAIKPRIKIEVAARSGTWNTSQNVYIRFLYKSNDTTRTSSTLYTNAGSYNKVYTVVPASPASASYFYIDWTDKAGNLSAAQVDGGSVAVSDATYTKSGDTLTITAPNHGLTAGMQIEMQAWTGPLKNYNYPTPSRIDTVDTATTNSFTVTDDYIGRYSDSTVSENFIDVPRPAGGVNKQIVDTDVDRVRLNFSVPSLVTTSTTTGNVGGSKFTYAVDVQLNGGGYINVKQETIKGKTTGGYAFSREINLRDVTGWNDTTIANNFPVDFRIRRISGDSTAANIQNAFAWTSYVEIVDSKLRYPNSAVIGVEVDASEFNSIPNRVYHIKGIKIRIPSNATVDSTTGRLTYAGTWDGTFAAATWCACPAWILYDLLTSRRYGAGEQILTDAEKSSFNGNASRLDKWAFYAASQYANELVDTGLPNGPTQEPRFSCNANIQSAEEAFTLINNLLSVFRSQAYWANGSITIAQDRPQDASYLFSPANVINGDFSYAGSDIKTRPTVVSVRYFDPDTRDTATEVVEDADQIDKYGVIKQEIEAFACTSQSQAARVGRWLLYSNQYEGETITFSIGMESGVVLRPGMIIKVADPMRAGTRMSGRVSSATTTTVVIDVTRSISSGDVLSVVLPTGLIEERTVDSYNSGTRTITVTSAFSQAPSVNTIWLLTKSAINPTTWRVLSVNEDTESGAYGVAALSYNSSKYAYVESGEALQTKQISILSSPPPAPKNIQFSENLYADSNKVFVMVSVSWSVSERAVAYRLRYRVDEGNWNELTETTTTQVDITNAQEGVYEVEIYAVNVIGRKSKAGSTSFEVIGKTALPGNVQNLSIDKITSKTAELSWDAATDLDVLIGGKVIIRHTTKTSLVDWQDTTDIRRSVSGVSTKARVSLLAGTYAVKFEDSSGNRSEDATFVVVTLPDPQKDYTVATYNEDTTSPPFQGNLTNMLYSADQDALILDQGIFIDAMAVDGDFDALPSIDSEGGIVDEGEYEFGSTLDLTYGVFDVDFQKRLTTRAFLPGDLWDDRETPIDQWSGSIDGGTLDAVNAELYVRSTTNDPSSSDPTYTDWEPLTNGTRQGRGFQFKVVATSGDEAQNILVDELGVTAKLQSRQESAEDVTSGAAAYTVTYDNAFYGRPSVGISAEDMATGDYYQMSSQSRTGFTITFRNSAGTAVSRKFDWVAIGYGKQLA